MNRGVLFSLIIACGVVTSARAEDHHQTTPSTLSYSAFIDSTLGYDGNDLPTRKRPYTTQPYYADEPALNLGYVDATLQTDEYHGRLALQYGSSVVANYAAEPHIFFRYIQEGYIGADLAEGLTLDVGIFFSHIGMESWISRDNINLSRSLIAENSPYYQSGARLLYTLSPSMKTELYLVRGWQNISDTSKPAVGTRVTYTASPSLSLQHSTFVGDVSGGRLFNHVGFSKSVSQSVRLVGGYDLGLQERRADTTAIWHGWALSTQVQVSVPVRLGFRVERYSDPSQVIVQSLSSSSFTTVGLSCNLDYALTSRLVWRNEYRAFVGSKDIFPNGEGFSSSDSVVQTSLAYSL